MKYYSRADFLNCHSNRIVAYYSLHHCCDVDYYYRIVQVGYDLGPHLNYKVYIVSLTLLLCNLRFREREQRRLTHLLNEIHFDYFIIVLEMAKNRSKLSFLEFKELLFRRESFLLHVMYRE